MNLTFEFNILIPQKLHLLTLPKNTKKKLLPTHPRPLQSLFRILQLLFELMKLVIIVNVLLQQLRLRNLGLGKNSEPDLSLHHPHNFVNVIQFVLARHIVTIVKICPPNISQEVVPREFLLNWNRYCMPSGLFIIPFLPRLEFRVHELNFKLTNNCPTTDQLLGRQTELNFFNQAHS